MRVGFLTGEVGRGLRRNITMTIAVVITTAISLGLLGGGLLFVRQIERMQALYFDRLEVAVFLTAEVSGTDMTCSRQPCVGLRSALEQTDGVKSVEFESRAQAYQRFREIFRSQPELVELARPDALPASLRVKLVDPRRSAEIVQKFNGRPGVDRVSDQSAFLHRLFDLLAGLRNATFAIAAVQVVAAVLLISNAVRVAALTRRTEIGIMRLVGATRWFTQLPFLVEAMTGSVVGSLLAVGGLFAAKPLFLDPVLAALIEAAIVPEITYADIGLVSPILVLVGLLVSGIAGYLTLRRHVRI